MQESPIDVTKVGIVILMILVCDNASFPIDFNVSGNVIYVSKKQLLKQPFPIEEQPFLMSTLSILVW